MGDGSVGLTEGARMVSGARCWQGRKTVRFLPVELRLRVAVLKRKTFPFTQH